MRPSVVRRLIYPAFQRLKHQNGLQLLQQLERTQWLAPDQRDDLRWQRVGALLDHAAAHVPYYRDLMRSVGADAASMTRARSLTALPLLDRATMETAGPRFLATNIPAARRRPNGTGGSTGTPLRFSDDRAGAGWEMAAVWRAQRWCGADVGDRCAYLWGANFEVTASQGIRGRLRSYLFNLQMLPAWELNESTARQFRTRLRSFRPRLLLGYASALYHWARLLGKSAALVPELAAVIVSAETLHDEWRAVIERCFGVPVYNRYGGRDLKFVAQECPAREGLHINVENVFVEIVRDGKPMPPGTLGEIVITRLDNFAMPFIRYASGDLGVMSQGLCSCGRTLPLLQRVEGRVQDAILTAQGGVVSGPFFPHLMKDCPEVKEFQVHQLALDRLQVLVVLERGEPFASRNRIERIIRAHLGDAMRVEFEIRDAIPVGPSGKRRVTVSHLPRGLVGAAG